MRQHKVQAECTPTTSFGPQTQTTLKSSRTHFGINLDIISTYPQGVSFAYGATGSVPTIETTDITFILPTYLEF